MKQVQHSGPTNITYRINRVRFLPPPPPPGVGERVVDVIAHTEIFLLCFVSGRKNFFQVQSNVLELKMWFYVNLAMYKMSIGTNAL
jgi:hypothetical protein